MTHSVCNVGDELYYYAVHEPSKRSRRDRNYATVREPACLARDETRRNANNFTVFTL